MNYFEVDENIYEVQIVKNGKYLKILGWFYLRDKITNEVVRFSEIQANFIKYRGFLYNFKNSADFHVKESALPTSLSSVGRAGKTLTGVVHKQMFFYQVGGSNPSEMSKF